MTLSSSIHSVPWRRTRRAAEVAKALRAASSTSARPNLPDQGIAGHCPTPQASCRPSRPLSRDRGERHAKDNVISRSKPLAHLACGRRVGGGRRDGAGDDYSSRAESSPGQRPVKPPGRSAGGRGARSAEPRRLREGSPGGDRARQGALLGHAGRQRRRAGVRELPRLPRGALRPGTPDGRCPKRAHAETEVRGFSASSTGRPVSSRRRRSRSRSCAAGCPIG